MIVNQFRVWIQTVAPNRRAEGASALARACLYSDLDEEQRAEAVQILTYLLDDPSPLVRQAMAEALASALHAPHHLVLALAEDHSSISAIVLARSPVLSEVELIDCAAVGDEIAQAAIADRADLTPPVAAALAEVASARALVTLARNHAVKMPEFSIRRMIDRHGEDAELREALLQRPDLPVFARVDLVTATTRALATFVAGCNWLSDERMTRVAREARDRAAIVIAETSATSDAPAELVAHLRQAGQLTVGFILRAILSGRLELFKAALADLSGVPLTRVDALVDQCESAGFAALYRKADLPPELLNAFRIALRAIREADWTQCHGGNLSRTAVERVLTACELVNNGELDKLIVLLRRFEAEAAREQARQRQASHVAARQARAPLALEPPPLLLTDAFEDEDEPAPPRGAGAYTIDMEAIAAELIAA